MIATHNLDEDKFLKVLNRKCFICPSIALTVEDNLLASINYGNISVLFNNDVIDPSINSNALLLSGDGYTSCINSSDANILSNTELVDKIKNDYFNNKSFMYYVDENICKSAAAISITMEEAEC